MSFFSRTTLSGCAATLLMGTTLIATGADAAPALAADNARALYDQERAVCLSGRSNQDRATCLKEAGAALAEARKRGPADDPAQLARNARLRCDALGTQDRPDCLARMDGQGTTRGSVLDGGIYRELVTREIGVVGSAPATPATAPK